MLLLDTCTCQICVCYIRALHRAKPIQAKPGNFILGDNVSRERKKKHSFAFRVKVTKSYPYVAFLSSTVFFFFFFKHLLLVRFALLVDWVLLRFDLRESVNQSHEGKRKCFGTAL